MPTRSRSRLSNPSDHLPGGKSLPRAAAASVTTDLDEADNAAHIECFVISSADPSSPRADAAASLTCSIRKQGSESLVNRVQNNMRDDLKRRGSWLQALAGNSSSLWSMGQFFWMRLAFDLFGRHGQVLHACREQE